MKKIFSLLVLTSLIFSTLTPAIAEDAKTTVKKVDQKIRTYGDIKKTTTSQATTTTTTTEEELISVRVVNDFDKPIKVKLGAGREVTVGAGEKSIIGNRTPGRYTLEIFDEDGNFIDSITEDIKSNVKTGKDNFAFKINEDTISNHEKIEGWSTGKKVAVAAGAVGATALGAALINKALNKDESTSTTTKTQNTNSNAYQQTAPRNDSQLAANPSGVQAPQGTTNPQNLNNAFAQGGKAVKVLNAKHEEITLIVEGNDGSPIGSNWVIPKAGAFQGAKPVLFNGQKVTIADDQKISVVIPGGYKLDRYAFELDKDPLDGSYVWVIK